ncbi:MAG: NOL1/NOP2/sun family putative RNA methylase [Clostridia bacterium]|nr:NOL1/NOP2/sun family putative RNA methylase [Clostridia bacterium]
MKALPTEFCERMKALLGDSYGDFINAYTETPVRAFRVNTDKISVEEFLKINPFDTEKIPYVENGFYFTDEKIGNHPFHHAGMIYVQEPGAMAPAECIDLETDWCVLDMCSAPGGKSSQLKNKLGENGILVSNEIIPSRCKILTGNVERLGLKNVVTTCMDTGKLAKIFPNSFDLIMVDAPCSGEGMFRKDDVAIDEWSEENVKNCASRQKEILENAVKCLKNGGYIIYATCTFSLEENEMTVDWFLKNHPDFELVRVKKEVEENTCDGVFFEGCTYENINFARRFYPHKSKGEGQFMAVLHNKNTPVNSYKAPRKNNVKIDKTVFDFLDDTLEGYSKEKVLMHKGTPVYFTPDFSVENATVFSCGITIGEIKKNYIQPHHQFFMGLGDKFKRKIDLSPESDEIKKYLHGEEFEVNTPNGWAVVTVSGATLGGVKVVNGRAKNHYPKGLRTK